MIRLIISALIMLLSSMTGAAQQLDSAKQSALGAKLAEYFEALKYENTDVQMAEADFLIESTSDSLVRQYVACSVYEHFAGSPIMGAEAVAIHVYDKWFKPGLIAMRSDIDKLNAGIFAEFNRQSLIGMKAPELVMQTMDGDSLSLFADRHSVLFFYDAGCAKCKIETILLGNLLETGDYPIDFYAVYAGDNRQAWEDYMADRFDIESSKTRIHHLWDPELDSDFQRKYGVVQTPRMFLIGPDQVIKGRGLDTYALAQMLEEIFSYPELEYGSSQSEAFFDRIFSMNVSSDGIPDAETVSTIADELVGKWLHSGDTTMYRQMAGDLLYYLAPKTGEGMKEGMDHLIDEYILGREDIWKSKDDSLKIVGFAQIMDDLLSKSTPGSRIEALKVPGELLRHGKKIKSGTFNLRKIKGQNNVIIFYTEGCHICDAEKAAARKLVAEDASYRVLMVNVDRIMGSGSDLADKLFDRFDLSSLPFIIQTDRKGVITRRYISLQK